MRIIKSLTTVPVLLLFFLSTNAQVAVVNEIQSETFDSASIFTNNKEFYSEKNTVQLKSFIVPAALVTYGAITMGSHGPNSINGKLQESIWINKPHASKHYDTYLMFAPAVSVYALNAFGVKGKNNFRDRTMIYFMSNLFATAMVYPTKKFTKQPRPDGSNNNSFPSGHTATAFASAEFMRLEYKDASPWYGVAGYVMATATGYLRMYNNKHWLSDVVAGAGVGIASTKLAYWLYPKIQHSLFKDKNTSTMILPMYQNKSLGFSLVHNFK